MLELEKNIQQLKAEIFKKHLTISELPQLEITLRNHLIKCFGFSSVNFFYSDSKKKLKKTQLLISIELVNRKERSHLKDTPKISIICNITNTLTTEERRQLKKTRLFIEKSMQKIYEKKVQYNLYRQWKEIFDSIPSPICITNGNFLIFAINKTFKKVFYKKNLIKAFDKNSFKDIERSSSAGHALDDQISECVLHSESGKQWFEIYSHRLHLDKEIENKIFIHFFKNITEDKKIEKKLMKNSKKETLGIISSSIAHELNNPIAGILNYTSIIKREMEKENLPFKKEIQEIQDSMKKSHLIVKNLLIYSKKK